MPNQQKVKIEQEREGGIESMTVSPGVAGDKVLGRATARGTGTILATPPRCGVKAGPGSR
jgi:hypothetical protein